jgi:hypothetical protein
MRNVLRSVLGLDQRVGRPGPRATGLSPDAVQALRSISATEAFISASNARLAAWRSAEGNEDGDSA